MKQLEGYTLMTMKYVNTSHLIADCPKSMLPTAVLDFLCHLIDGGYFLLGIPEMKSLNEAERLVIAARDAILNERQCPINHSNKFYELIPHKGDPMRRPALDNLKICNSKLIYVARMKATLEQLLIARQSGQKNPLDYFLANWLNADVGVLDRESQDFRTLERVAMRTQHPNASNKFRVSQIFTVNGGVCHQFAGHFARTIAGRTRPHPQRVANVRQGHLHVERGRVCRPTVQAKGARLHSGVPRRLGPSEAVAASVQTQRRRASARGRYGLGILPGPCIWIGSRRGCRLEWRKGLLRANSETNHRQ